MTHTITVRSSHDQCVSAIEDAVKEFLLDQPQIAETVSLDEVWVDMAASLLTEAAPKVAEEVCRTQIGYVPQPLRRLWAERIHAQKVAHAKKAQERKQVKRESTREANLRQLAAAAAAQRANTCQRCFTVRAANGSCNC